MKEKRATGWITSDLCIFFVRAECAESPTWEVQRFSALFYSSEQIAHRGFCKRFENPHFAERGLSFSITKIDLWSCANRRTIFREGFESLTFGVLFFSPRSFSLNNVYLIMVSIVGATFPALRKLTDFQ